MAINIAIDGPSAAGKSSVADKLAQRLNYTHLDTGAMYRMVAYLCEINNISTADEEAVIAKLNNAKVQIDSDGTIHLNDEVINDKIRSAKMSMEASNVSKNLKVREALVKMQQDIAKNKGYILDGRDIGSVVLKDAEVKIFLMADPKERAKRRVLQEEAKGNKVDFNEVLEDINKRDYQDTHRANSPLVQAKDAILVDSSFLSLDEVVDKIYEIIQNKLN